MADHTHPLDGIVDNLVTQFADPLDALRELVQNSIDAGTSRVEVWTEFELADDMTGVISVHVDDFGEGMDESIIDHKLTRLFSSTKEGDLTKIGKFGIGFVSIFALKPHAVMLRTGRAGEYWELLFSADRSFTKTRLEFPVEGTQITLFIAGDWERYRELTRAIPATLTRWCVHSETELIFLDQSPDGDAIPEPITINQPFAVDGHLAIVKGFDDGTEIAVAFSDAPVYGFYNRGLTLTYTTERADVFDEGWAAKLNGVSVKLKSRYLEHTLARDSVVRDENYDKTLVMLEAAMRDLRAALVDAVERLADQRSLTSAELLRYATWMGILSGFSDGDLVAYTHRRLFRPLHGGPAWSLGDLRGTFGSGQWRLLVDTTPTDLSERLAASGTPIVWGAPGSSDDLGAAVGTTLRRLLELHLRGMDEGERAGLFAVARRWWRRLFASEVATRAHKSVVHLDQAYAPVAVDSAPPEAWLPLIAAAEALLSELDYAYETITTAQLVDGSLDAVFVVGRPVGGYMALPPEIGDPEALTVAVLRNTPHMQNVLRLWATYPKIAAYMLAKALMLPGDSVVDDVPMVLKAMELGA